MLQLHQGYNLYNIGFSCGFIGLFAANLLLALNRMQAITVTWNTVLFPSFGPACSPLQSSLDGNRPHR